MPCARPWMHGRLPVLRPARNPELAPAALPRGRVGHKQKRPPEGGLYWAPDLFNEPSFRLSRGPKRSPSLNFARVRRAGLVEGLSCYLPMRFVAIGQPHVHHERISVVCAFDPNRARLWFQSHRDKSHFPIYPGVAKNLRLEGTSAFRFPSTSYDRSQGTQSKAGGFVPHSIPIPAPRGF